jgi:hypothetical protein
MLNTVDTKSPASVAAFVRRKFGELFPGAQLTLVDRAFAEIEEMYTGRHPGYLPIDLGYHNLEHTLQATVCITFILEGAHQAGEDRQLTARQFELAVIAALLHDTGYLKHRFDTSGTGAKYTLTHVLRSCAFAASYLPTIGVEEHEIAGVLGAINCTGPAHEIGRLTFNTPTDRFIGCALATADYLGQMADPVYADKLTVLYGEFLESDNFVNKPFAKRLFKSAEDLTQKTPDFWVKFVRPRLDNQLDKVYRYLARPFPDGRNEYLEAVEQNIATIRERLTATAAPRAV